MKPIRSLLLSAGLVFGLVRGLYVLLVTEFSLLLLCNGLLLTLGTIFIVSSVLVEFLLVLRNFNIPKRMSSLRLLVIPVIPSFLATVINCERFKPLIFRVNAEFIKNTINKHSRKKTEKRRSYIKTIDKH